MILRPDYIAFGPVFATVTKEDPDPVVGLNNLIAIKRLVGDIPLVAIGGINEKNIANIYRSGADCAAVISCLFEPSATIADNVKNLIKIADDDV